MDKVTVVGAGLAGCEAAWQLAVRGVDVRLVEMKPDRKTPAHVSDSFAELVCSNSFRSDDPASAAGLLKAELRRLGSLVMACADAARVAAGGALAVDRDGFSAMMTERVRRCANIELISEEAVAIPDGEAL
ncbi:MAG: FAD-dependent oxidoreductase, partial [Oscillospiraceae bacterium]|nr:FAD-dependent oxidoreductase [Oscillospiraceae bacterium]